MFEAALPERQRETEYLISPSVVTVRCRVGQRSNGNQPPLGFSFCSTPIGCLNDSKLLVGPK